MRINFSKQIEGERNLKGLVTLNEPEFANYTSNPNPNWGEECYIERFTYDLGAVASAQISGITRGLENSNIDYQRDPGSSLWISTPPACGLNLHVKVPSRGWNHGTEKIGTHDVPGWLLTSRYDLYREVPSVDVSGQVDFESSDKPDPSQILEVLSSLNYRWNVTATPKQVEGELRKRKAAEARKQQSRTQPHHSDDDSDLIETAATVATIVSLL